MFIKKGKSLVPYIAILTAEDRVSDNLIPVFFEGWLSSETLFNLMILLPVPPSVSQSKK